MEFKILQTKKDYRFMDYEYAINHGFNLDDYETVWEEEMYDYTKRTVDGKPISDSMVLETIFNRFNLYIPENYEARSLSVSDIVVLGEKQFYCDSFGWKELWSFLS